ncbi:MAG: hypothetical protein C4527_12810 [Candidatus Omnitrophota bacterium]|jgi:hypothetical protein|nr:MAG: hypothetical protein C4527_12810 [Candidatus Omnitrophota bacterium]
MKHISIGILCLVFVFLASIGVEAQIQTAGVLRDEYALGLTPPIKSLGMGGAYVGVDHTMSMNPASLSGVDFREAMLMYGLYDHDQGPTAHRGRGSLVTPVPYIGGVARLMLDGLASDGDGATKLAGNPDIEFDGFTLGLQYGRNIVDWAAVGVGAYPYEKANVELGGAKGEALSQIGSMQLGTLLRPHEKINIGAQFIYIKDDLEVSIPGVGHFGDYYHIHYFAVGASFMPFDGTLLALDYWNGEIEGSANAVTPFDVDIDRWNFGVQQRVCQYADLRLGSNNGGLTTGFTVHITEDIDFDYAYINKAMRDKEDVFDETEFHGFSLTYRF